MQIRQHRSDSIVVRLPNWVGDVVMATPALRALRRALTSGKLILLGKGTARDLLHDFPGADAFVTLDAKGRHAGGAGRRLLAEELRGHDVSWGVLLPHSFSSAWTLWRAGVRRLVGWATLERRALLRHAPWPPRLATARVPRPMPRHYLELLGTIGVEPAGESLELAVSPQDSERARERSRQLGFDLDGEFFCVNPGASFGASKFWTVEGFIEVIRQVDRGYGARTVVLCGPGEEALAREIAEGAGSAAVDSSRSPFGLGELKAVLQGATALVTTDTGPRHIATAFDVPVVVLMGPTDPRYTACNLERTRVLRIDVDCGPCHLKTCPLDHRCMKSLQPEWVLRALGELLQDGRRAEERVHA